MIKQLTRVHEQQAQGLISTYQGSFPIFGQSGICGVLPCLDMKPSSWSFFRSWGHLTAMHHSRRHGETGSSLCPLFWAVCCRNQKEELLGMSDRDFMIHVRRLQLSELACFSKGTCREFWDSSLTIFIEQLEVLPKAKQKSQGFGCFPFQEPYYKGLVIIVLSYSFPLLYTLQSPCRHTVGCSHQFYICDRCHCLWRIRDLPITTLLA